MIYSVRLTAPAINEEIVLSAESEEAARAMAVASALARMQKEATVIVTEVPPDAPISA